MSDNKDKSMRQESAPITRIGRALTGLFIVMCVAVFMGGFSIYKQQAQAYQTDAERRLQAIAQLKASEIALWLNERRGDVEVLSQHPLLIQSVKDWQASADPALREKLIAGYLSVIKAYGYESIFLLDAHDRILLHAGNKHDISPELRQTSERARATGKVTMSELYFVGDLAHPEGHLEFAAPIAGSNGLVLVAHAEPENFLFPLIRLWPGPSASGETLLARKDDGQVLFLNELRQVKTPSLRLRLPLDTPGLTEAVALYSTEDSGFARGRDYHQAPVFAAWQQVPGTSWKIISKEDEAEVLAPLHRDSWIIGSGMFAILTIASLLILYLTRRQKMALRLKDQAERQTVLLRENELRLQSIAETAQDAIILMDHHGNISMWNPAAERIFGYSAAEAMGKELHRLIVPEEFRQAHYAAFPRFQQSGQGAAVGQTLELAAIRKDGARIPVELSLSSFQINGRWHAAGILRDISVRTQAENALRESEARFRDIANISADWIWEIDSQGLYTYASQGVHDLLGYTPEEIVGRTPFELMTPQEAARVGKIFASIVAKREPFYDLENTTLHKEGPPRIVLSTGMPVLDGTGNLIGYRGVDRDITDKKRIDAELAKHSHHLEEMVSARTTELELARENSQLILDSSADGIYGIDMESRISFINPAACEMLGYAAEELIGKDVHPIIHHSHADGRPYPAIECPILVTLRDGSDNRVSHEVFWRKNGLPFPINYAARPMLRNGQIVGAVISFTDISLQLAAEEAREQALREATRLARVRSEFLANMSHEIRTPLNAVLGFAQIGVRESEGRKLQAICRHILDSGSLLLGIINDILDFSKFEAGKFTLDQDIIDLAEVIRHVADLVQTQARDKGLEFSINMAAGLPTTCRGDGLRLSQILTNLLSNAVKFTEHGSVSLAAEYHDGSLLFRVTDSGIGMNKEQQARLFQPFEQADGSITRKFGGSGLGLSISKRLVDLMGGEIWVESQPGQGSIFELHLPCVEPSWQPAVHTQTREPLASAASGPRLGKLSILVAEDNKVNQLVLENMLASEGCRLTQVENGRLAVERVQQDGGKAYDVVLMDIQMPEMDGYEATRLILELAPGLPIIGLTAHAMAEERQRCLAAGMVDHVAKPIDLEGLIAAILRQTRPGVERKVSPVVTTETVQAAIEEAQPDAQADALESFIDWPALEVRYRDQPRFMLKLLTTILQAHTDKPGRLRGAANLGDFQQLADITHSMKGMAGEILPSRTRELAGQVETAARHQQTEAASLSLRLADTLEIQLDDIAAYVRGKTKIPVVEKTTAVDWTRIAGIVARLEPLLAADDTAANELFDQTQHLLIQALGEAAKQLGRQIETFDYQKALATLHAIQSSQMSANDKA